MKIGIVFPQPEIQGDVGAVDAIGRAVEQHGFDHLLVYDHVLGAVHADRAEPLMGPYTENDPFQDPLTMFAYLAGITERIGLMSGVLILPQRQTALVARQAADVDLLSGGRLTLGIGLGWNHVEYDALGHDFRTRGARCSEQMDLLRKLWSGDVVSYEGRFESAERVRLTPAPTRQIPLWIGGFAAPAIERTGRLADGFVAAGPVDGAIAAKKAVDEARERHGRADRPFGHTLVTLMGQSEDDVIAMADQWREAGGTHLSVCTMGLGFGAERNAHLDFIGRIGERLGV